MWGEKFSEVSGGCSVQTVMGVQEDFKLNAKVEEEPVQAVKDGSGVLMFTHLHQDPGSAVLNILEPLKALVRDPDEECVTIIQPEGDKGMDEPLSSRKGERWPKFGDVTKVKEGSLADMVDVIVKAKKGVKPDSQISHGRREGKVVAEKGDRGNEVWVFLRRGLMIAVLRLTGTWPV